MKTEVLISSAVTAKLICPFNFAMAKFQFSHDKAHSVRSAKHFVVQMDFLGKGKELTNYLVPELTVFTNLHSFPCEFSLLLHILDVIYGQPDLSRENICVEI